MKIAYVPLHTQADIFFPMASATRLSAEWRIGVIQALVQLGHEVEVCAKIPKEQKFYLDIIKSGESGCIPGSLSEAQMIEDYGFYKDVEFNETGYPVGTDILLIEGGSTNSFHTRKLGNRDITIQEYAFEAICRHKGRVFWFCPEPDYAFRFGDLALPTGKAAPATDLRRLLYSSKKFLEDKKFIWLMTDHKPDMFLRHSNIPNDFPLESIAFAPYSLGEPEICAPAMDILPIDKLEWDVVYIGHLNGSKEKKRREQLTRMLSGASSHGIRAATFGNIEEGWSIPGVKHFPKTANMGEARGILNRSLFTPLAIRHDFVQTQHESNRQAQAAQCGCIPIWPLEVEWMGGYQFLECNHMEDLFEIKGLMDSEDREMYIEKYRKSIPKYIDWLPKILEMPGAAVEDKWHKDLEPFAPEDVPTLL